MSDSETPSGWLLTIPDEVIRFTKMFEILILDLKRPVIIDNTIVPNSVAVMGTGDSPSNLEKLGFVIHDGVAPAIYEPTAQPLDIWLSLGRGNEVKWKLENFTPVSDD